MGSAKINNPIADGKEINNENSMDKENRSKSLEAAVSLIEKNYGILI